MEKIKMVENRIREILRRSPDTHNQYTPFELCKEMVEKALRWDGELAVMFNLEFLYVIKGKINNLKRTWFFTPCEIKARVAIAMGIKEENIIIVKYLKNKIGLYSYKDGKEIIDMPKFDVVVGNPPYMKNMHLKFLRMAYDCLKKDGKIVWIHPARWMQDPLAPIKKGSDFNKYKDLPFVDFKIISAGEASNIFNNRMTSDLVISYLKKGETSILDIDKIFEISHIPLSIKKIFYSSHKNLKEVSEENKIEGIRVRLRPIIGMTRGEVSEHIYNIIAKSDEIIIDGFVKNVDWTENVQRNQFTKPKGSPIPVSIKFNTEREAQNFIDSTNTEFYTYLNYVTKLDVHVQLGRLPFMGDYNESWTNEKFQKYFEIPDKDMKFIKDTIKNL